MKIRQTKTIAAALAGLIVALGCLAFLGQRWLSDSAFGTLESNQAAQDAQRVKIALDYEVKLLANYGSTNSIWTSSYDDVHKSDRAGFASDFPPAQVKSLYGLDAVLGVGADGTLHVGGLTNGGSQFGALPPQLADQHTLAQLIDTRAKSGQSKCGAVSAGATPYVFCSFPAARDDSSGVGSGSLIYLAALDPAKLAQLSKTVDMPLALVAQHRAGRQSTLHSSLGAVAVTTTTLGSNRMALDISIPTVSGSSLVLEVSRARPIHAVATGWSQKMLAVIGGIVLVIIIAVVIGIRRAVSARVQPLRRTTEEIISSGDRSLRINSPDRSDIGALANAIDTMLDSLAEREGEIARAQQERVSELRESAEQQRVIEQEMRAQAEVTIRSATNEILAELEQVLNNTAAVHSAAGTIDERVEASSDLTRTVLARSRTAGAALEELSQSLQNVAGVAQMIAGVAKQTNLLALNATIEAARAGEAGKGFSVVASEVKELALATSNATAEITGTIDKLQLNTAAMSASITEVGNGVEQIDSAAQGVNEVTLGQRETARRLNASVNEAIDRVRSINQAP